MLFEISKFFFNAIFELNLCFMLRFTLFAAFFLAFAFRILNRVRKWRKFVGIVDRIPGPPGNGIWGHTLLVMQLDKMRFKYGTYVLLYQMLSSTNLIYEKEKICRFWLGLRPLVILFTPEAVEVILSSNSLTEKSAEYSLLKPWLGEGLVTSNRLKWKRRRKILTPAFHFRILRDFLPIIGEHAAVLVDHLRKVAIDKRPMDITRLMSLCTLDVICETAMGLKVNCLDEESEYVNALHQVSELILFRLSRPWFWFDSLFHASKHGKKFKRCLAVMKEFTVNVIEERKDEWLKYNRNKVSLQEHNKAHEDQCSSQNDEDTFYGKKRLAFLDLLLEQHLINNLTINDVREEVDTFMFAGHDTTAMSISWTLYMLGLHQDVQSKVRQEVDEICDQKRISKKDEEKEEEKDENKYEEWSVDDMKEMKYLDCVLKEVQRVYPTAPFIGREITQDVRIGEYTIPRGTTCGVFTFLLHRDPKIYEKPERFDPDRFLPENCVGRHPFAYVPFSAGPRNCIGQKFALMEQKLIVASVVRNFYFSSVDQRDKLIVSGEMVLRSRNGLRLLITPRDLKKKSNVETISIKHSVNLNESRNL